VTHRYDDVTVVDDAKVHAVTLGEFGATNDVDRGPVES